MVLKNFFQASVLYASLLTFVLFMVFDFIWWGIVANDFFKTTMSHLARYNKGKLDIYYPSGAFVYVLMSIGLTIFVINNPSVDTIQKAFLFGGLFGLCLFSTFDFTNHAIIANYPIKFAVVDTVWGALMCSVVSAIVYTSFR